MTDKTTPAPDDELETDRRQRELAHASGEHAMCSLECEAVFPTDWLRSRIVGRWPGATGMLAELERRARAAGRADGLHEAAGYARSRSADNWGAASGSPSTVLCTVSDELYAQADGIHRGQA